MNTVKQFIFTVMALCLAVGATAAPVSVAYTYDALNRLTAVSYADGGGVAYTYDGAGKGLPRYYNSIVGNLLDDN
jgi:RHS Repeat